MRKYPQHVLKRVIRDDRGASLKNSGRTYGGADRCYKHNAVQDKLHEYLEPKSETNPIIGVHGPTTGMINHAQTDRTMHLPTSGDNKIWIQPHMENQRRVSMATDPVNNSPIELNQLPTSIG